MSTITPRALFGGAITMDLQSDLKDASDLRQVPDNQEVFLSPDSDASYVLEVLQRVDVNEDEAAAKFHFNSLAYDNAAISQKVVEVTLPPAPRLISPPATPNPTILVGVQEVQKFNHTAADQVRILMALYRIEGKGVDLVLTANIPLNLGGGEQSNEEHLSKDNEVFYSAARSLRIVDFGLFA